MGMAGVSSTHTASFTLRPCCPSLHHHSSIWLASSRSSLLLCPVRFRRHLGAVPERNSNAHSPTNSGPLKPVPAPWTNYSPVAMKDCWNSGYDSLPSSHTTSGPLPSFIKQDTYQTRQSPQKYDHTVNVVPSSSKLEWEDECRRLKLMRMRDLVCKNTVKGGMAADFHQGDCLLNKNGGLLHANAEIRKNVSACCLPSHKPNSFADKNAMRNSLAPVSGGYGLEISKGIPKVPKILLTDRLTMTNDTAPSECSTGNSDLSSQTFRGNTMLNESYRYEWYTNGKQPEEEINGSTSGVTERSSECSSGTQTVKTRCRKDTDTAAERKSKLLHIYDDVLLVDNISTAKDVVQMLTTKYKDLIHACDTEVSKIDVKQETPVDHGEIVCFSIYSGSSVDFGNGKSCIWVDVLDGESDIMMVFAPFFEDPTIKKVWHNYSFDRHVIENYGIKLSGFHADTMHLARLWDSSRRMNGGYSLEALTGDPEVISKGNFEASDGNCIDFTVGKISMKEIFGKKKVKKDGTEGKLVNIAPVESLQREERIPWICYSALDSISTLKLFQSLESKLMRMEWISEGQKKGNMYDFYEEYWRPFGNLLVEMEAEGMLVNRAYLSKIEKVAIAEQQVAADKFRKWASAYCADAKYMNVGSDTQIRQLFFGGVMNKKNSDMSLPVEKTFKVPNIDNVIEEGKKSPTKFRNIKLTKIVEGMQAEIHTASGWPSVSGDALKIFAGKVAANEIYLPDGDIETDNSEDFCSDDETFSAEEETGKPTVNFNKDTSAYGTAFAAFGKGKEGRDACHAIAALCEICSIDSLISNFILPLQGNRISGKGGRIHCSLNINTETGRLSARRPNLQNPPALEKDRYKIREAFIAAPGNSLIVADYGQLELRILAHLANCQSMLDAFEAGGDFHSRTAMNMYEHIRKDVEKGKVLIEWHSQPGEDKPPAPLLKDAFASERRKAKMLNFSIAYGKTPVGLARDWKVSVKEAKETVNLWYKERQEVLRWQETQKEEALTKQSVQTLLGRARNFPSLTFSNNAQKGHIERAAINAPVQGSAADVAMCAMLQITRNKRLKELKWKLLLQVHDEVILEGPSESAEEAKAIVVECMSKPFNGRNILKVDLSVDAKIAHSWYAAK